MARPTRQGFTSANFAVEFIDDNEEAYVITGHLTSLVPEPGSLILAMAA